MCNSFENDIVVVDKYVVVINNNYVVNDQAAPGRSSYNPLPTNRVYTYSQSFASHHTKNSFNKTTDPAYYLIRDS